MSLSSPGRGLPAVAGNRVARGSRLTGVRRSIFMLSVLLIAGCSAPRACPDYRVASGVSVDASAFVAAHPRAWQLCVAGAPCLVLNASDPRPAVVRLSVDAPGLREVDLTVTARDGAVLLRARTQVQVRHVVVDSQCGISTDSGAVTVAGDGSLSAG
jgi:hypothetical protein